MAILLQQGRNLIPFFGRQRMPLYREFYQQFPRQNIHKLKCKIRNYHGLKILPSLLLQLEEIQEQSYRFVMEDDFGLRSYSAWFGSETHHCMTTAKSKIQSKMDYFVLPRGIQSFKFWVEFLHEPVQSYELVLSVQVLKLQLHHSLASNQIQAPKWVLCQYEVPKIGHRICSPTTVAMLLDQNLKTLKQVVTEIYHESGQIYGMWPQAIHILQKNGRLAMNTFLGSGLELTQMLNAYGSLGASIQVNAGELAGFPLTQGTAGHLVLICGIEQDLIWVADPANPAKQLKKYDLDQFLHCLSKSGGLVYLCVGKKINK